MWKIRPVDQSPFPDPTRSREICCCRFVQNQTESHKSYHVPLTHTLALWKRRRRKKKRNPPIVCSHPLPLYINCKTTKTTRKKGKLFFPSLCVSLFSLLIVDSSHIALLPCSPWRVVMNISETRGTHWKCGSIYRLNCLFPHILFSRNCLWMSWVCVCLLFFLSFSNLWLL